MSDLEQSPDEDLKFIKRTIQENMELLLMMVKRTGDKAMIKHCDKCCDKVASVLYGARAFREWIDEGEKVMKSVNDPDFMFRLGYWWEKSNLYPLNRTYK